MNRRGFLSGTAGLASVAMLLPGALRAQTRVSPPQKEVMAGWKRRIQAMLDRGRLPIIDLQATYVEGSTDVSRMIGFMDEGDVAQIAFAAANARTSEPSLTLHRAHPEYFIPTTNSGEFPRWWRNPVSFLAGVEQDLKSGQYYFMGEHEFRHYPSPEQVRAGRTDRDISIDIDGAAGHALFQLSEQSGAAFQIHYEIEDQLLPALESMLGRYPKARVIWCHLAMIRYPDRAKKYDPEYVSTLIERYPGLHFDLAVPPPDSIYRPSGARHSTLYSTDGRLDERWRAVLEKFPERFLSASDYRPPVENEYPQQIARQRELILAVLSEKARHLVAYGNSWRLVTGAPWGS